MPPEIQATLVLPLLSQRDEWLRQAVESCLRQTVACAVLVITSPRTPEGNLRTLAELAAREPNLRIIERPPGAAFAGAINHGFRLARTERVGLLLTDDWLEPTTVEKCLPFTADIVATARAGHDANGRQTLWRTAADAQRYARFTTDQERASYIGHFFLMRREAMLAAGGVDPDIGLTGADDYDLPWTMLERGATVHLVNEELYHVRDHADERLTLRDQESQIRDLRRLLAKHGVDPQEIERLVVAKKKWYGAPVHQVIANPGWYLASSPANASSGEPSE